VEGTNHRTFLLEDRDQESVEDRIRWGSHTSEITIQFLRGDKDRSILKVTSRTKKRELRYSLRCDHRVRMMSKASAETPAFLFVNRRVASRTESAMLRTMKERLLQESSPGRKKTPPKLLLRRLQI
jgi:hypothetical protein